MVLGSIKSHSVPEFVGLPRKKAADARWSLVLDSGRLGNVYGQDDTVYRCTLQVTYRGEASIPVCLDLRIYRRDDEVERTLGQETRMWTAVPGETTELEVDFTPWIDRFGVYYIQADILRADGTPETAELFSVSKLLLPDAQERRMGMSVHFPYNGLYTKELIPQLAKLGVGAIRTDFGWVEAELEKGVIQAPAYWDELVDLANAHGIEILAIIDYGNPFYDDGWAPYTQEGLAAYERYCRFLASHFKGRVSHFEIWNEYNINYANHGYRPPEAYAAMIKVAYPAIKEENPQAMVVGGAMSGIHFEWIRRVLAAGALPYMDALSFHPYCSMPYPTFPDDGQGQMLRNMNDLRQLSADHGQEKPVWITEMGWATYRDSAGVTREIQAADAVRMFALSKAAGPEDRVFWYDFINDEFDKYEREHQFGIVEAYDASVRLAAKEAYAALCAMNNKLAGAHLVQETRLGEFTRLFEMKHPSKEAPVFIFWSLERPETLRVKVTGDTAVLTDMYGNRQTLQGQDGYVTFTSGVLPQYIEGLQPAIVETSPQIRLKEPTLCCVAGESVLAEVCGHSGDCRVEVPEGFCAQSVVGDEAIRYSIVVPASAPEREYQGRLYCQNDEGVVTVLPFTIRVVPQYSVLVKPCSISGNWCLAVEITNHSNRRTISGRFRITEPECWRRQTRRPDYDEMIRSVRLSESARYEVAPLQTQTLLFGAPAELGDGFHTIGTEVLPDMGAVEYTYHRLSFFGIPRADTPIPIDGTVSCEKWGEPQIRLDEKDFIPGISGTMQPGYSAEVFLRWDEENFYLAARVKDAVHCQTCTCGDMWQDLWDGDGIQLLLDPLRETRANHMDYNEIGISRTSNTDQTVIWRWRTPFNRGVQLMKDIPCVIRREEGETLYEVAFPWETLLPDGVTAQQGKDFGFALGINDNNGEGCVGRLIYHKGIGYWYDQEGYNPQLCGDMVLL